MTRIFQLLFVAALLSGCSQHGAALAPTANAPFSKPQVWEEGPLPQKWQFFPNVLNGTGDSPAQPVTLSSIVTDGDYHVWAAYRYYDPNNEICMATGLAEYNFSGTLLSAPGVGCPNLTDETRGGDGNVYAIWGRYISEFTPSGQEIGYDGAYPIKHLAEQPNVGLYYTIYDRPWMTRVLNGVTLHYHFPDSTQRANLIAIDHANRIWVSITAGAATASAGLAQFNPSTAHFTFSGIPNIVANQLIVGPDDNLWFASGSTLSRVTTNTSRPVLTKFTMRVTTLTGYLTSGPDGNLWLTYGQTGLLSVSTSGHVVSNLNCPTNVCNPANGDGVLGITAGDDGNLWFVYSGGGPPNPDQFNPYSGIVAYIRLSIDVAPSAVTLSNVGKIQTLKISETSYSGPWTARSTQPAVVKLLSISGNLVRIESVGAGKGRIIITDSKTNYVGIPVTVE